MHDSLDDHLTTQLVQLASLSELLDIELQLISSREPDKLLALVNDKEALLDAIHVTDQQIKQLFNAEADDQVFAMVEQIKDFVEHCRHKTAINQKAVEQGQLRVAHLRNLMMEVRAKESLTYDKTGRTSGGTLLKGIQA